MQETCWIIEAETYPTSVLNNITVILQPEQRRAMTKSTLEVIRC